MTCDALGTAEIVVQGIASEYTYTWSNGAVGNPINNLIAGIYTVTVTDVTSDNCFNIEVIQITDNCNGGNPDCTEPTVNVSTTDATCTDGVANADGTAAVEVSGALSDYTFAWSNNPSNTNTATGLAAGTYVVTVTNADDTCFTVEVITIQDNCEGEGGTGGGAAECQTPELTGIDLTAATCNDNGSLNADGSAVLTLTQTPDNYTFIWTNNVGEGNAADGLAAGYYEVTITNVTDTCYLIQSIVIEAAADCEENPDGGNTGGDGGNDNGGSDDCTLPIVNAIITDATCDDENNANTDGTVTLIISGGADYDFVWSDGNTDSLAVGLAVGFYEVTVSTAGAEDCAVVEVIAVGHADCNDIDPTDCTEPWIINSVVTPTDCETANGTADLDMAGEESDYLYLWSNGATTSAVNGLAAGTYTVTVTNTGDLCYTVAALIVTHDCPDAGGEEEGCGDIFTEDFTTVSVPNCEDAYLCVPIMYQDIDEYTVTDNGVPFGGPIGGCNFFSVFNYSYATLPGQGQQGPYLVDSWSVNGTVFSGTFADIQALTDSLNAWDATGEWTLDSEETRIIGGDMNADYSQIVVVQPSTFITANLKLNTVSVPASTAVYLPAGEHTLVVTNNETQCADTIAVTVECSNVKYIESVIPVNTQDTLCLENIQLPGTPISFENVCDASSGEYVIFDINETGTGDFCVVCEAMEVGRDSACLVICDDLGYCDTTYLMVSVITDDLDSPIAVNDVDSTFAGQTIVVDVLPNDTVNGVLSDFFILEEPQNGTVNQLPDGTITYTPNDGECDPDEADTFTYTICNYNGCDTATVFITVDCQEFLIFSGFSPNGDGVNDTWVIKGINRLPETNSVLVFNRWGNEVYGSENYQNDWDGSWNGDDLPDGTYFYIFSDGRGNKFTGYVHINRG